MKNWKLALLAFAAVFILGCTQFRPSMFRAAAPAQIQDFSCVDNECSCFACELSECNDGIDNDGDGKIDSVDPNCAGNSITEFPQPDPPFDMCSDGVDNDGDGLIDRNGKDTSEPPDGIIDIQPDPQCSGCIGKCREDAPPPIAPTSLLGGKCSVRTCDLELQKDIKEQRSTMMNLMLGVGSTFADFGKASESCPMSDRSCYNPFGGEIERVRNEYKEQGVDPDNPSSGPNSDRSKFALIPSTGSNPNSRLYTSYNTLKNDKPELANDMLCLPGYTPQTTDEKFMCASGNENCNATRAYKSACRREGNGALGAKDGSNIPQIDWFDKLPAPNGDGKVDDEVDCSCRFVILNKEDSAAQIGDPLYKSIECRSNTLKYKYYDASASPPYREGSASCWLGSGLFADPGNVINMVWCQSDASNPAMKVINPTAHDKPRIEHGLGIADEFKPDGQPFYLACSPGVAAECAKWEDVELSEEHIFCSYWGGSPCELHKKVSGTWTGGHYFGESGDGNRYRVSECYEWRVLDAGVCEKSTDSSSMNELKVENLNRYGVCEKCSTLSIALQKPDATGALPADIVKQAQELLKQSSGTSPGKMPTIDVRTYPASNLGPLALQFSNAKATPVIFIVSDLAKANAIRTNCADKKCLIAYISPTTGATVLDAYDEILAGSFLQNVDMIGAELRIDAVVADPSTGKAPDYIFGTCENDNQCLPDYACDTAARQCVSSATGHPAGLTVSAKSVLDSLSPQTECDGDNKCLSDEPRCKDAAGNNLCVCSNSKCILKRTKSFMLIWRITDSGAGSAQDRDTRMANIVKNQLMAHVRDLSDAGYVAIIYDKWKDSTYGLPEPYVFTPGTGIDFTRLVSIDESKYSIPPAPPNPNAQISEDHSYQFFAGCGLYYGGEKLDYYTRMDAAGIDATADNFPGYDSAGYGAWKNAHLCDVDISGNPTGGSGHDDKEFDYANNRWIDDRDKYPPEYPQGPRPTPTNCYLEQRGRLYKYAKQPFATPYVEQARYDTIGGDSTCGKIPLDMVDRGQMTLTPGDLPTLVVKRAKG